MNKNNQMIFKKFHNELKEFNFEFNHKISRDVKKFIKKLNKAHKATKNSKLVFK